VKVTNVQGLVLSSPYGSGSVLGQPLGLKSIGLVVVETDAGLMGVGESYSAIYVPELFEPIVNTIAQRVVGMDPCQPEAIFDEASIPFVSRNGLYAGVYSAVDIALWDIASQASGAPIHHLLSGQPGKDIQCYASGGSAALSAEDMHRDVIATRESGFDSYKMRVGFHDWSVDLDRAAAARSELGRECHLMIDAIMGTAKPTWTVETAANRIADLEVFQPYWIEEPLHPQDLQGLRELRSRTSCRIATGEALSGEFEFREYLASGAVDVMQIDVTHCGGFTVARRVVAEATRRAIPVAMHVWGSALALAANSEFAFAFPAVTWLEVPTQKLEAGSLLSDCGQRVARGYMHPIDRPGLATVDPRSLVDRYPFVRGTGFKWGARATSASTPSR